MIFPPAGRPAENNDINLLMILLILMIYYYYYLTIINIHNPQFGILLLSLIFEVTANGVIRVRSGRYMDQIDRAGLKFNFLGSVRSETAYFFRVFFCIFFFKADFSYLFSYFFLLFI